MTIKRRVVSAFRPTSTVVLLAAATVLAGCGSREQQHLARADVAPLIALADRIPNEGACAQARDIRALSAREAALTQQQRLPAPFERQLGSAVAALAEQTPACLPSVPASTETTPPPTTTTATEAATEPEPPDGEDDNGGGHEDKHQHKEKHKDHGKHGDD